MDKYLLDGHKMFWHLDRLKEWQDRKITAPLYLEISPVSYCNHRCMFCGLDFAMKERLQLDTDVLCRALKEMGERGVRSIMYAGEGEPLLHKGLRQIIETTKASGIDASLTTNGTVGSSELWGDILPDLSWVKFSVDAGTSGVYSRIHNVSEKFFDKTLGSISDAVKIKRDRHLGVALGVQFLVLRDNIADVENAIRLFSRVGVDYLVLKPFSLHPQMLKKMDVLYTEEEINDLQALVDRYTGTSTMDIVFRKGTMMRYVQDGKEYRHCLALPFWGYISSNGDFYTCSVYIGDEQFRTGNIYLNTVEEILFGEKRRASIGYAAEELLIEECRKNCRMARVNEFLELLGKKPEHVNFI
jgi:GTP 3',8-cyclase